MCILEVKPLALVLEDNESAGEALSMVVRDWGADVALGASLEALETTLGDRIAEARWIITDYHLGNGKTGVSAARLIVEGAPAARVLVLTGSSNPIADRDAASAGFELMRKPVPAEAILAWLERA